jgi:hypothetical protein
MQMQGKANDLPTYLGPCVNQVLWMLGEIVQEV